MRLNGEDKDRGGTRRGYVEMDGVILRREGLDLFCRIADKEFWVTGGQVFNTDLASKTGPAKVVIPLWLARHQKLV
ncbi:MAG: hypothetical protein E6J79_15310 [Deltaproteobacteria bacterium]|nr:MAG: hypothetical protein E6J79_15310 [Deltaproteobacteria bacterium]